MTITSGELTSHAYYRLATGYIINFGTAQLGYCTFNNYAFTYTSGPLAGEWVKVRTRGTVVTTNTLPSDAIKTLPGGRVFNPWAQAQERIPTYMPIYTQRIQYLGDIESVMREYEKLMKWVGVTAELTFSLGRGSQNLWTQKTCNATLLPFSSAVEQILEPADRQPKTVVEFAVQWQQVGEFYA